MCKVGFYDGSDERFKVMNRVITRRSRKGENARIITLNERECLWGLNPEEIFVDTSVSKSKEIENVILRAKVRGVPMFRVGARGQVRSLPVVANPKGGYKKV